MRSRLKKPIRLSLRNKGVCQLLAHSIDQGLPIPLHGHRAADCGLGEAAGDPYSNWCRLPATLWNEGHRSSVVCAVWCLTGKANRGLSLIAVR